MTGTLVSVSVPCGSTIGYGTILTEDGTLVDFAADHRPLRNLGLAAQAAADAGEEAPVVELEDWQVLATRPA